MIVINMVLTSSAGLQLELAASERKGYYVLFLNISLQILCLIIIPKVFDRLTTEDVLIVTPFQKIISF